MGVMFNIQWLLTWYILMLLNLVRMRERRIYTGCGTCQCFSNWSACVKDAHTQHTQATQAYALVSAMSYTKVKMQCKIELHFVPMVAYSR